MRQHIADFTKTKTVQQSLRNFPAGGVGLIGLFLGTVFHTLLDILADMARKNSELWQTAGRTHLNSLVMKTMDLFLRGPKCDEATRITVPIFMLKVRRYASCPALSVVRR